MLQEVAGVTRGYKGLQRVTKGYERGEGLREVTGLQAVTRWFQMEKRDYRKLRGVIGGFKG